MKPKRNEPKTRCAASIRSPVGLNYRLLHLAGCFGRTGHGMVVPVLASRYEGATVPRSQNPVQTRRPADRANPSPGTRRPAAGNASGPGDAAMTADPPEARVLRQFRVVFNAVKSHFQQVERQAGIGGAQAWALAVIRDRPGIGVNDLAVALNVRQPTASYLVKELAQHGLIEARRDGPDRRAVQLHVLPEAKRVLRRVPGPFAGVLPAALASLSPHVLTRLEGDLAMLIDALGADQKGADVPLANL